MNDTVKVPQFQEKKRQGIIIYVKNLKNIRPLRHYGQIYYVSKKMKYVVLYVDENKADEVVATLNKQNFVKKVVLSHKREVNTDYHKGEE